MSPRSKKALVLFWGAAWTMQAHAEALEVDVEGLRAGEGSLAYALFDHEDGFPSHKERALKRGFLPIPKSLDHDYKFSIGDLAGGEYALLLYQDLNDDKILDKNFLGIPKEPVGASNNPKSRLGPPRYKDCKFQLTQDTHRLTIRLVK